METKTLQNELDSEYWEPVDLDNGDYPDEWNGVPFQTEKSCTNWINDTVNRYLYAPQKIGVVDYRDMIDDIIDNFDFEKVHQTMVALNWKWAGYKEVPEIPDLRKFARARLKEAHARKTTISSGGFKATYEKWSQIRFTLRLEFIVSDWDCDSYDIYLDNNE